jgi:hypothetical protein
MPIVVTLLIGVVLGVALVVATVVDKQREPVPDAFRVALGARRRHRHDRRTVGAGDRMSKREDQWVIRVDQDAWSTRAKLACRVCGAETYVRVGDADMVTPTPATLYDHPRVTEVVRQHATRHQDVTA